MTDTTELRLLRWRLERERCEGECELRRAVLSARDRGATWAEVGQALGVSKQAAQQRYGL